MRHTALLSLSVLSLISGTATAASLRIFPTSALRGEVVLVESSVAKPADPVLFGVKDSNFRVPLKLNQVECPEYFRSATPLKGVCVKIPLDAWGGPQQLSLGTLHGTVNVFGESVPSPQELRMNRDGPPQPGVPRAREALVPDPRRVVLLWFPSSYPDASRKLPLERALRLTISDVPKITGFIDKEYGLRRLTPSPISLGGAPQTTCGGYLELIGFQLERGAQERLGLVLELVRTQLVGVGQAPLLDAYAQMSGDPVTTYSMPGLPRAFSVKPGLPNADPRASLPGFPMQSGGLSGVGTTIAVIDSGVTTGPELDAKSKLIGNAQGNFTSWGWVGTQLQVPNGSGSTNDDFRLTVQQGGGSSGPRKTYEAHGTAVAVLAAGNTRGVAPAAQVLPIKVCQTDGSCPLPAVIQGVCQALKQGGKLVINLSLGGDTPSSILSSVLQDATRAGVPVVTSVGNAWHRRQVRVGQLHHYPADARDAQGGAILGVIGVGAVGRYTSGGAMSGADFSQQGVFLDVYAPGVRSVVKLPLPPGATDEYDGTSFAAPLVAGALALSRERTWTSPATLEKNLKALQCGQTTKQAVSTNYGRVPLLDLRCLP